MDRIDLCRSNILGLLHRDIGVVINLDVIGVPRGNMTSHNDVTVLYMSIISSLVRRTS